MLQFLKREVITNQTPFSTLGSRLNENQTYMIFWGLRQDYMLDMPSPYYEDLGAVMAAGKCPTYAEDSFPLCRDDASNIICVSIFDCWLRNNQSSPSAKQFPGLGYNLSVVDAVTRDITVRVNKSDLFTTGLYAVPGVPVTLQNLVEVINTSCALTPTPYSAFSYKVSPFVSNSLSTDAQNYTSRT